MGIGIPGSGKTTVLKEFAKKNGYEYVSLDDIRGELAGAVINQSKNGEVVRQAYDRMRNFITSGKTVVYDATSTLESDRLAFISFAREQGAQKIQGIFVDTPIEIAKERNANRERVVPERVLERQTGELRAAPPGIVDGFDSVFTLNENQELVEVERMGRSGISDKEFKVR